MLYFKEKNNGETGKKNVMKETIKAQATNPYFD
jgi:hypothetical protein